MGGAEVGERRAGVDYRVIDRHGESVTVRLEGELVGVGNSARLRQALEEHFVDDGVQVITLDLSTVSFLDNYGATALVALMQESERRGKRLFVTGADRQVRDKLRVTGILNVLEQGNSPETSGS